jgi:hypothetical protein
MNVEQMARLIAAAQLEEAQRSARVRSKIYGYGFGADGQIIVIDSESEVVASCIQQVCGIPFMKASRILELAAEDLRKASPQTRNRSGRLFTGRSLAKLISNPIYAGLEEDSSGRLVRINNYAPLVSERQFRDCLKRLRQEDLL